MNIKPRLPEQAVIHYDTYKDYDYSLIEAYDTTLEKFGEARETKRWSKKFADYFAHRPSEKLDHFISKQHLFHFNQNQK
jgi:FMN reductase [NAD(P)H]